ncbi:MAG: META domain-containing protein [Patescibacteria group bacterium]|nr:META domain-containing protein [bacterium]MDZ4241161.1 META domain-containing protein [Patescibacteria group bacterium]
MNPNKFFIGRTIGLIVVLAVAGLVALFFAFNNFIYNEKQAYAGKDYKNAEYVIDGNRVRLSNGLSEIDASPDSASKIITRYFGNEVMLDLNDDGREDAVFLLTQETGGSGQFFYVVAALNTERGYIGSQGLLLGDRIAPQTTELSQNPSHKNVIVVNYADRVPGEPMTAQPSVGKSIWLKLDPQSMQFGEVVQDFEGEADPSRMTLDMKSWTWIRALYNDGREILPKKAGVFTLDFSKDGKFSVKTDCNSMGGTYSANGGQISFTDMMSTKMYCEGSQESEFANLLTNTSGYHFTSRGELVLDLKFDSGSVIFR